MSYLLDTQVILWMDEEPSRLSSRLLNQLNEAATLYCSAASCWEIAIKRASGRLRSLGPLSEAASRFGLTELPVTIVHGEAAGALPRHHGDPFDRVIVAQAMVEGLTLVTSDAMLQQYEVKTLRL